MPWFDGLRESVTWRRRRDHALGLNAPAGYISLADTMPELRNVINDSALMGPLRRTLPTRPIPSAQLLRGTMPSTVEIGASGTENVFGYITNDEYNPKLAGRAAIDVYDMMRRSDPQVHASLDMIKLPIRSADPNIEAASDDPEDVRIADFCTEKILGSGSMRDSFKAVLRHILLSEDFGTSALEKVFKVDDDGSIAFHRLAPRLPKTFERFDVDANGNIQQLIQYAPKGGAWRYFAIPAEYLAIFPREMEGDNYWGMSVLRPAYKPWYYKNEIEHIDMIAHDKFGVGTPVAKLLPGFPVNKPGELSRLENALMGLRSGQRNFMIINDKVDVSILVATNNGGRNVKESLDYHNSMIVRNILANHLAMGDSPHGTYNLGIAFMDLFLYALQARTETICEQFDEQVIHVLCDLNFDMTNREYPHMRFDNLTNFNIDKLGNVIAPLVTAKALTATDDMENMLRQLLQLPPLPAGWERGDTKPAIPVPAPVPAAGAPGSPTPPNPQPGAEAIAATDRLPITVQVYNVPRDEREAITLSDVEHTVTRATADAHATIRGELERMEREMREPLQPLHINITLPNGNVIRTTTQNVTRDQRGLIIKTDRVETERPDDAV
jgi:hypothetical protein